MDGFDVALCWLYILALINIGASQFCPEHDGPADCTCPPIGWEGSEILPTCKLKSQWITQPSELNGSVTFESPCLDFRDQGIVESFQSALDALKTYYPFTAFKALDWEKIQEFILPKVQEAAGNNSASMYMEAMLKLITYIPDGHVSLSAFCNVAEYANATKAQVGGSFGFTVAETDDAKFVVTYVAPGSQAFVAGIRAGDELKERGEPSIPMATWLLTQIFEDIAWTLTPPFAEPTGHWTTPARPKTKRRALVRAALRAPIGSTEVFVFEKAGARRSMVESRLTAYDDSYMDLKAMKRRSAMAHAMDDPIKYDILPSGFGYIAIAHVKTIDGTPDGGWLEKISEAMNYVKDTAGLIIDLRSNSGGVDFWASVFPSFFAESKVALYGKIAYPNAYLNTSVEIIEAMNMTLSPTGFSMLPPDIAQASGTELYTMTPRQDAYKGDVACIINDATIGSGEGLARACKTMIAKYVVGFDGTSGSFGVAGARIVFPGGNPPSADAVEKAFMITFPAFYSADANGDVQLESGAAGKKGGVYPTRDGLIPSTAANLLAYARGIMNNNPSDDIEVETAELLLRRSHPLESQVDLTCTPYSRVVFHIIYISYSSLLWLMRQSH